jgi:D-amino-acid oxidase
MLADHLFLSLSGDDLVLEERGQIFPVTSGKHILVVGGGVTGLSSAWALLDAGFRVTIISDYWAPAFPKLTSQIAGALYVFSLFTLCVSFSTPYALA